MEFQVPSISNPDIDVYYQHLAEESKDEISGSPGDFSNYDNSSRQNSGALKNVKFILFKSQHVLRKSLDKKSIHSGQTSKTPKLKVTQRSRMAHHKEEYYP
jgi:hypothetical protein